MTEHDISTEVWREYTYTDGYTIRIDSPQILFTVGENHGHRVFDGDVTTYVPKGWRKLVWKAKDGSPDCSF